MNKTSKSLVMWRSCRQARSIVLLLTMVVCATALRAQVLSSAPTVAVKMIGVGHRLDQQSGQLTLSVYCENGLQQTSGVGNVNSPNFAYRTGQLIPVFILGKPYPLTVTSSQDGSCEIAIKAPPGYAVQVDGRTQEVIQDELSPSSPGTHTIVVLPTWMDGNKVLGIATALSADKALMHISLGHLKNGDTAGYLTVLNSGLHDFTQNYSPASLAYELVSSEIKVYRASGGLSQILTNGGLVTINQHASGVAGYEIRFYAGAQFSGSAFPYSTTGSPFLKYDVSQVNLGDSSKLKVTKTYYNLAELGNATPTVDVDEVTQMSYVTNKLTIDDWHTTGTIPVSVTTYDLTPDTNSQVEVVTTKDQDGATSSCERRTYTRFNWGWEWTEKCEGYGDANLVTTRTFYTDNSTVNADEFGQYSQIESVTSPNGNWEAYDYRGIFDDNGDYSAPGFGQVKVRYAPFEDSPATWSKDEAIGQVTVYSNAIALDGIYHAGTVITYVNNTVVDRSDLTGAFTEPFDGSSTSLLVNSNQTAGTARTVMFLAGKDVVTETINYNSESLDATLLQTNDPLFSKQQFCQVGPDGNQTSYVYEYGTYNTATRSFTPSVWGGSTHGSETRVTSLLGTGGPDAGGTKFETFGSWTALPTARQQIASIYLIPYRSTMATIIRDARGLIVKTEKFVFTGEGDGDAQFSLISWESYTYNAAGEATEHQKSNGEIETFTFIGDRIDESKNNAGTSTKFGYDDGGRTHTKTVKGVVAYEDYPAQPDRVVTYEYSGDDRVISETRSAGSLSLSSSRTFDLAGRLTEEHDEDGLVTTYEYPIDPATALIESKVTMPGESTKVTKYYRDGRVREISGSAVVGSYFDYSVAAATATTGTFWSKQTVGTATSGNWIYENSDWSGRKLLSRHPDSAGEDVETVFTYNDRVQLWRTHATGSTGVTPDTLTEYDELGLPKRTGLDLHNTGTTIQLDLDGTDRIRESSRKYVFNDGAWWWEEKSSIYATSDSDVATQSSQSDTRLTGFPVGTISEVRVKDADGNVTVESVTVDASHFLVTKRLNKPASTIDEVSVTYNGIGVAQTSDRGNVLKFKSDALGRLTGLVDPRKGEVETHYLAGKNQVEKTNYANGVLIASYTYGDDGRVVEKKDAAGHSSRFGYNARGQLIQQWGDGVNPAKFDYDSFGRQEKLTTYRGGTQWGDTEWPAGDEGVADVTLFRYYGDLGILHEKEDALTRTTAYEYDSFGRKTKRTDPRNVVTTFEYYDSGDLESRSYSDGTPTVDFTYTRTGLIETVKLDNVLTRTLHYRSDLQLDREDLSSYYGTGRQLKYVYDESDVVGRSAGFKLGTSESPAEDQDTAYDYLSDGRLWRVTAVAEGGTRTFEYDYTPDSDTLVASVSVSSVGYSYCRTYDSYRDLVETADSTYATALETGYTYTYNSLSRRATARQRGEAFSSYGDQTYYRYEYDSRGQMTGARNYLGEDVTSVAHPLDGRLNSYGYDFAGNRVLQNRTDDVSLADIYGTDACNEVTYKENRSLNVQGTVSNAGVSVLIDGRKASRQGNYWNVSLQVDNTGGAYVGTLGVVAASPDGVPLYARTTKAAFLQPANEVLHYDEAGNLTEDGQWSYSLDAENRLVRAETSASASAAGVTSIAVAFDYDYMSRRVGKRVYSKVGGNWVKQTERRFIYAGWNTIAEVDEGGLRERTFFWGLDVSGSFGGAGGAGGLLEIVDGAHSYLPAFDGDGNIVSLLDSSQAGQRAATYEYSPFGVLLAATGSYAKQNPFRWSSKWSDEETDLVYYGHRFYAPRLGRFITRDPIEEKGGLNLYGFVANNPAGHWDLLGLAWDPNQALNDQNFRLSQEFTSRRSADGARSALEASLGWRENSDLPEIAQIMSELTKFSIRVQQEQDKKDKEKKKKADAETSATSGTSETATTGAVAPNSITFNYTVEPVSAYLRRAPSPYELARSGQWGRAYIAGCDALWDVPIVSTWTAIKESLNFKEHPIAATFNAGMLVMMVSGGRGGSLGKSGLAAESAGARTLTAAEESLFSRVSRPKGFKEQVWEINKGPDGLVRDPSGKILKFDEPWELGHVPGNKFSDAQIRAAQQGWDRATWIKYQNDPYIYRPELPRTNAGHLWEASH